MEIKLGNLEIWSAGGSFYARRGGPGANVSLKDIDWVATTTGLSVAQIQKLCASGSI